MVNGCLYFPNSLMIVGSWPIPIFEPIVFHIPCINCPEPNTRRRPLAADLRGCMRWHLGWNEATSAPMPGPSNVIHQWIGSAILKLPSPPCGTPCIMGYLYHLKGISLVVSCCWQFFRTEVGFAAEGSNNKAAQLSIGKSKKLHQITLNKLQMKFTHWTSSN